MTIKKRSLSPFLWVGLYLGFDLLITFMFPYQLVFSIGAAFVLLVVGGTRFSPAVLAAFLARGYFILFKGHLPQEYLISTLFQTAVWAWVAKMLREWGMDLYAGGLRNGVLFILGALAFPLPFVLYPGREVNGLLRVDSPTTLTLWLMGFLGILVLAPAPLVLAKLKSAKRPRSWFVRRGVGVTPHFVLAEMGLLLSLTFILTWGTFSLDVQRDTNLYYLCLIPLLWATIFYGVQGSAVHILTFGLTLALFFGDASIPPNDALEVRSFLMVYALIGLGFGWLVVRLDQTAENLDESEGRYKSLFEGNGGVILLIHPQTGRVVDANPAACAYYGYSRSEMIGMDVSAINTQPREAILARLDYVARERAPANYRFTHRLASGETRQVSSFLGAMKVDDQILIYSLVQDVEEQVRAEAETARQIRNLEVMHAIDQAITGRHSFRETLDAIIELVLNHLGAEAGEILIYDPDCRTLTCEAARGFQQKISGSMVLPVDYSYAGQVASLKMPLYLYDLAEVTGSLPALWEKEGFRSYFSYPLVARGEAKGVLELYYRHPHTPDENWYAFFKMVAEQVAIALDNGLILQELSVAHQELQTAYDLTLEGWAKALELRDAETEGHSRRVTEMTVRVARALGIRGEALDQIRRGALLHDIGKMGVPDAVLRKEGALDDAEWALMKQHPTLAYNLLAPIPYLRTVTDIPYCHHEKWDGTGYPRGLKGEAIPLAARIFTVVDVWDALLSDRPYRKAWPAEKVRAYLREQAGTQFDPRIIDLFLSLWKEGEKG